jgi:death on curing protein
LVIEAFQYLTYPEAVAEHIELMQLLEEVRYGVFDRTLIESALARPQQAASYNNADVFEQSATLLYGLIKNHPWIGGNKRTATHLTDHFLKRNGYQILCSMSELIELVLAIEADQWDITRINEWMRQHTEPFIRQ